MGGEGAPVWGESGPTGLPASPVCSVHEWQCLLSAEDVCYLVNK